MQLSTDLPCGVKAVADHLASGQSLQMNVSPEADQAFRLALKNKRKSSRWQSLEHAMRRDFYRQAGR